MAKLWHFSWWKDFGKKLLGEGRGVAFVIGNHFSGELWSMGEFSGFYSFTKNSFTGKNESQRYTCGIVSVTFVSFNELCFRASKEKSQKKHLSI